MLDLLGWFGELVGDMLDVEVYKCKEKPSFTLFDVYTMVEFWRV